MRKNIILIDFESIQPESIEAITGEQFHVLVFVGSNQSKLSFNIADSLQKMGSRAEYIKISGSGPNALDFHIAYYIGKLSNQNPSPYFHIISKDKGFDPLIQHLRSINIYASRSESISKIPLLNNLKMATPVERARGFISHLSRPKVSKPRTKKSLSSAIKSHFRNAIEDSDIADIITAIQKIGFLKIVDEKITYTQLEDLANTK